MLIAFLAFAGAANAAYAWRLGDGSTAAGAVVSHTYASAERYAAVVTASGPTGATAQTQVEVVGGGRTLTLGGPARTDYGAAALTGSPKPALRALALKPRLEPRVDSVDGQDTFEARVPTWIAPQIFDRHGLRTTVAVFA